jgi:hypothetical protein
LVRRTPRFVVVALPVVLVVAALWLHPASSGPNTATRPTIEPTLPLYLDLGILPADQARGVPPRLQATLDASGDLQEVFLSLVLPEAVSAGAEVFESGHPTALRAGEKRVYSVPIQARRAGAFPIKLEASFRLPDGRVFHTQQGIVWRVGAAGASGHHHAGAYEWMGVPVEEPQP